MLTADKLQAVVDFNAPFYQRRRAWLRRTGRSETKRGLAKFNRNASRRIVKHFGADFFAQPPSAIAEIT